MVAELGIEVSRTIKGRRKIYSILINGKTEWQFKIERRKIPEDSDLQERYYDLIGTGVNPGSFC